ncbi:hypothetical protein WME73_02485 [Sorangium sp. So ce302]|uniref:hypothetical protein n=1 Tax=Sorangium sp. So ce302 TaxID=3133297 RepID=UPI003F5F67D0
MAEAPEHAFLKTETVAVLNRFARLRLYGCTESDRRRFDLACMLERDWKRPLVGQVLWKHSEGLEKDIRTMVTDGEADIWLYVASDQVRHRLALEEVIHDYRRSGRAQDLFKLKVLWIPSDFDADSEVERGAVARVLESQIVEDILLNVVLGNLSADDVAFFLKASGIPGLNLAVLCEAAKGEPTNFSMVARNLGVSAAPIREKFMLLAGAGLVAAPLGSAAYQVTPRGTVFLDLLARVWQQATSDAVSSEMKFLLEKLGGDVVPLGVVNENREVFPSNPYVGLLKTIASAERRWGLDLATLRPPVESAPAQQGVAADGASRHS